MNILKLDKQGRARLKSLAGDNTSYVASVDEKGVITLVPVVTVRGTATTGKKFQKFMAARGIEAPASQSFPMEMTLVLSPETAFLKDDAGAVLTDPETGVPINNEELPPGLEDEIRETVANMRPGSGISAKSFIAKLREGSL